MDVARQIAETVPQAELFLYPGNRHLFTDQSTPDYDEKAAALVRQRVLDFLGKIG
ncbi:MAG TPA: dienelactone hydrolase family protein [Candidatus Eisenbacteria bacterium]|nr:dienelactone hydrolase family protein [Candidatus Eisenbacteria bacterium]